MSVVCSNSDGWVLCHQKFVRDIYNGVCSPGGTVVDMCYPEDLFKITTPFVRDNQAQKMYKRLTTVGPDKNDGNSSSQGKKRKNNNDKLSENFEEEVLMIKSSIGSLMKEAQKMDRFCGKPTPDDVLMNNKIAREEAGKYYKSICCNQNLCIGGNNNPYPIEAKINDTLFLLPAKCSFYQYKIDVACDKLDKKRFDFILLDPPWRNKFVRRKKMKTSQMGYSMIWDEELGKLPIGTLLSDSGLVAVWTTNALSHIETLKDKIFPIWGVHYISTWFWIKVTQFGEEVTPFLSSNGKQPYERLIFGCKRNRIINNPEENKCMISVPSAIHSHKPPLTELLVSYLPENPECLELFARYLLPNWTSCGDQVLSLQMSSLFQKIN